MKKVLNKKILFGLITTLLLFTSINFVSANWSGKSDCITKVKEVEKRDLYGIANYNCDLVTSKVNGVSYELERKTHWVETQNWGNDVMLVNWTNSINAEDWKGTTMTDLARQFEKAYPGWNVIAGINGDFFHISASGVYPANCEPSNGSSQMGNLFKPFSDLSGGGGTLGFKPDGTYVYGASTTTANEYVEVLDEQGNVLKSAEITNLNNVPTETGITLLTPNNYFKYPGTFDLTGYKVFVIDYELHRLDRRTQKVYLKGSISEVREGTTGEKVERNCGYAYLVSKDGSLDGILEVGTTLRCQSNYTGSWEGVMNSTGYYAQMLKDGQSLFYDSVANKDEISKIYDYSYINCDKNRTFIGFKENGAPVFVVSERAGGLGHTYYEEAEILKELGCVNGFVLDGGGSACMIVRTETGSFEVVNECQDGNPRKDANIIMIVAKDPGVAPVIEKTSRFGCSIDVYKSGLGLTDDISNIKVTVNNVTKEYTGSLLDFDGLEEATDYKVKLTYDIKVNGKTETRFEQRTLRTDAYQKPMVGFNQEAGTTTITVSRNSLEGSKLLRNVIVHVGDNSYTMGDNETFVIEGLIKGVNYPVIYEYDILDPDTGRLYHYVNDEIEVKTLDYELPEITRFELYSDKDGKYIFRYTYKDEDGVVKNAYLLVNDQKVELTKKTGNIAYEGVDLTQQGYSFKIVLEYQHEDTIKTIESETLTYEKVEKKKGCKKKSIIEVVVLTSTVSLAFFILKKKH